MFSCVWLHFKKCFEKYFLMFGCVLENSIENTFSHFLTFSWLPNDYIISFIHQNTNKTQKKIIKSGQTKARSRSARSWSGRSAHRNRRRDASIAIAIDTSRCQSQCADRRDSANANASIAIEIDASRRRLRCADRSDHDRADRDLAFVCPDLMVFFWVLFVFWWINYII